jgi:nitroreductase
MELKEAILKRQSIRKFKQDDVPEADIVEIVECATKAPSAKNVQNWYFVAIKSNVTKKQIAEVIKLKNEEIACRVEEKNEELANKFRKFCSKFTLFSTEAPVMIIVLSKEYIPMEKELFEITNMPGSKEQIEDLMYVKNPGMQGFGAAMNTFSLAAVDKGYGSCWLTSANFASEEISTYLKEKMSFEKEGYFMAAILALGIPEEGAKSPKKLSADQVLTIIN